VLDDRGFEMQKYLFPSFRRAGQCCASASEDGRRQRVGPFFWQPGLGRTSKITRRYLSTSDIERGNDEKLLDDCDFESNGWPELIQDFKWML
jgi:hypothetical protein